MLKKHHYEAKKPTAPVSLLVIQQYPQKRQ